MKPKTTLLNEFLLYFEVFSVVLSLRRMRQIVLFSFGFTTSSTFDDEFNYQDILKGISNNIENLTNSEKAFNKGLN